MTKQELQSIKGLKNEIRLLQLEIENPAITTDSVKGSMIEHPYIERTIVIKGVDISQYEALQVKLQQKANALQLKLNQIEAWIDAIEDGDMRQIIRLRFREGLNWKEVARQMGYGYTENNVKKRAERFLKNH